MPPISYFDRGKIISLIETDVSEAFGNPSWDFQKRRCQIAARIEDFKILSTKLQRAVSLGLNNLM
jgi:hypothetical protein